MQFKIVVYHEHINVGNICPNLSVFTLTVYGCEHFKDLEEYDDNIAS